VPFRTLLETIADHRKLPSLGSEAFVVVRDGGEFYGAQNCALVARETDGRQYRGVRTYDQALVAEAFDALA